MITVRAKGWGAVLRRRRDGGDMHTQDWEATALLREVVEAWDSWTRDDAAITWEAAVERTVTRAREFLAPRLPEGES